MTHETADAGSESPSCGHVPGVAADDGDSRAGPQAPSAQNNSWNLE